MPKSRPPPSDTLSEMERREWVEIEGAGPSKLRRLRAPKLVLDAWADFFADHKAIAERALLCLER